MKKTKGMPISHRAYLNCGASCHSSGSCISHPEEMHVEGVQDMKRFQKGLNDFVEERAHSGTTQSCLDAFSSIQSAQTLCPKLIAEVVVAQKGKDHSFLDCLLTVCIENQA